MIREDRELLAELARLNSDMAPLALRIMEGAASIAEQQNYAKRLIAAAERLQRRADKTGGMIIDGEVEAGQPITLPERSQAPPAHPQPRLADQPADTEQNQCSSVGSCHPPDAAAAPQPRDP